MLYSMLYSLSLYYTALFFVFGASWLVGGVSLFLTVKPVFVIRVV